MPYQMEARMSSKPSMSGWGQYYLRENVVLFTSFILFTLKEYCLYQSNNVDEFIYLPNSQPLFSVSENGYN